MIRCFWCPPDDPLYISYHDEEWGVPVHDDRHLFEMLILEGAQAGLSWRTILAKRQGYRRAFHDFDIDRVASMPDDDLDALRQDVGIVRNRLKIQATRSNARVAQSIVKEKGSLDSYFWDFVDGRPVVNQPRMQDDLLAFTPLSDRISKDLKQRGMRFVGSTIIYSFLQACGFVDDHMVDCWCKAKKR